MGGRQGRLPCIEQQSRRRGFAAPPPCTQGRLVGGCPLSAAANPQGASFAVEIAASMPAERGGSEPCALRSFRGLCLRQQRLVPCQTNPRGRLWHRLLSISSPLRSSQEPHQAIPDTSIVFSIHFTGISIYLSAVLCYPVIGKCGAFAHPNGQTGGWPLGISRKRRTQGACCAFS